MEARPDPVVGRFRPPSGLLAQAQRHMMEQESDAERYLRQQWEAALGASRVAMDSLRAIWPADRRLLNDDDAFRLETALGHAESLVAGLDELDEAILGEVVAAVLAGRVTTQKSLDAAIGTPPAVNRKQGILTVNRKQEILTYACEHPGQPIINPVVGAFAGVTQMAIEELQVDGWLERRGRSSAQSDDAVFATAKALDAYPSFEALA